MKPLKACYAVILFSLNGISANMKETPSQYRTEQRLQETRLKKKKLASGGGFLWEMPNSNPGPLPQKSGALSMSHHISDQDWSLHTQDTIL